MNKISLSHTYTKEEKEHALSLFRIPLNFFADNDNSPSDAIPETKIKIDATKPQETINIDIPETSVDIPFSTSSASANSDSTSAPSSGPSTKSSTSNNATDASSSSNANGDTQDNSSQSQSTSSKAPSDKQNGTQNSGAPQASDPSSTPQNETSASTDTSAKKDDSPSDKKEGNSKPSGGGKKPSGKGESGGDGKADSPDSAGKKPTGKGNNPDGEGPDGDDKKPDGDGKKPDGDGKKPDGGDKKPDGDDKKPNGDDKKPDGDGKKPDGDDKKPDGDGKKPSGKDDKPDGDDNPNKSKELDRMRDKFNDPKKGKSSNPASKLKDKKDEAKKKLGDKADKLTGGKFSQAKNAVNKAKNAANAIQNVQDDPGKAAEAAGDLAVKAASHIPVYGKAIGAADKLIGNTEVGKKAKKAIGCCIGSCCALGCLAVVAAIMMVVVLIMATFSWIFGGGSDGLNREDFAGYSDEEWEEFKRLQEASYEAEAFSLEDLIDEVELADNNSKPIDKILDNVLNNINPKTNERDSTYSYTQEDVDAYNSKYADDIKEGKLTALFAGDEKRGPDLTSFGMTFELLKGNYTISNLKMPSLAPERQKNGTTYVTYDPTGKHQALFEDALNNIPGLQKRFRSNVDPEWFVKNLTNILDADVGMVYIPDLDTTRKLTLRDLLSEVSISNYDTEYDTNRVTKILSNTQHNSALIDKFEKLQTNLAALEMLTYMLHYQQYYHQKTDLIDDLIRNGCVQKNIDMYNDEFFGQFLSFSDIQEFIALSTLADHSLAYEIACVSLDSEMGFDDPIITYKTINGNTYGCIEKLTNWYATYNFETRVINDGVDDIEIRCVEPIEETEIQQKLFDKYNVEASARYKEKNFYDEDPNDDQTKNNNATTFFSLFELATGISITTGYDGTMKTPVYKLSPNEINVYLGDSPIDPNKGRISFPFGAKYSSTTLKGFGIAHENHTGIDYACEIGTVVYAIADGTAYIHYGNTGWGNYVEIIDGNARVIYAHGSGSFYVSDGQKVKKGDPIMKSGNSGASTGPHLHLEVQKPIGNPIDPMTYNR